MAPPTPVTTGSGKSAWLSWLPKIGVVIVGLVLLAAAAYGGYYFEHMRATATESDLQSQIDTLKKQQKTTSPGGQTSTNTSTPACTDADLTLAKAMSQGAAGTEGITYSFTNNSADACTLTGFPGVKLLDASNKQLGEAAATDGTTPDTTLTLQKGDVAYANVLFPNPANFAAGTCSATSASMITFMPSSASGLLKMAISGQYYCPGFKVQAFTTAAP